MGRTFLKRGQSTDLAIAQTRDLGPRSPRNSSNEACATHGVEASMKCGDVVEPQSRQQFLGLRGLGVVAAVDDKLSIARSPLEHALSGRAVGCG